MSSRHALWAAADSADLATCQKDGLIRRDTLLYPNRIENCNNYCAHKECESPGPQCADRIFVDLGEEADALRMLDRMKLV